MNGEGPIEHRYSDLREGSQFLLLCWLKTQELQGGHLTEEERQKDDLSSSDSDATVFRRTCHDVCALLHRSSDEANVSVRRQDGDEKASGECLSSVTNAKRKSRKCGKLAAPFCVQALW